MVGQYSTISKKCTREVTPSTLDEIANININREIIVLVVGLISRRLLYNDCKFFDGVLTYK